MSFLSRRFLAHKIVGAAYLIWFTRVVYVLLTHPIETYATSWFWFYPVALHCIGLAQTLTALSAFSFLPRSQKQEGFFTDKTTISKDFVKENAFFVLLTLFAAVYTPPKGRAVVRKVPFVEHVMVFFPFQTLRRLFPKTSFNRHNAEKLTKRNTIFMISSKYIASYFYLFGKHYIGLMLNYLMFLDRDTPRVQGLMFWNIIGGGYNLTIGIFLHTLKFRKVLGPRVAMTTYLLGYLISGVPTLCCFFLLTEYKLWALATGGLLVNVFANRLAPIYQCFVAFTLFRQRSLSAVS